MSLSALRYLYAMSALRMSGSETISSNAHSGPVEINAAVLVKVVVFTDVLLEMGTRDAHALDATLELEVNMPGCGGRKIKLGDLVVLADVRVK